MTNNRLTPASIEWRKGTPYALVLNDKCLSKVYDDEASQYRFIDGNNLRQRWQAFADDTFTIVELGFGTSLNFLSTVYHWSQKSIKSTWLEYYAVEDHPLVFADLVKAMQNWPVFEDISKRLIKFYPLPLTGVWQIEFPQQKVRLTLLWMDADDGLDYLATNSIGVDAWYFDHFSCNQSHQSNHGSKFLQIASCSNSAATLAALSSSGFVSERFIAEGFNIQKKPDFDAKNEMITGNISSSISSTSFKKPNSLNKPNSFKQSSSVKQSKELKRSPWFNPPKRKSTCQSIGIIGAGIAGATTARNLVDAGMNVTIFDKQNHAGAEASGNSAGIYYPFLSTDLNLTSQFYLQAYHQLLHDLEYFGLSDFANNCGVLKLYSSEAEAKKLLNAFSGSDEFSRWLQLASPEFTKQKFSKLDERWGVFFPQSGYLKPKLLCQKLVEHPSITQKFDTQVNQIHYQNDRWQCITSNNESYYFDALVVCNSHYANSLLPQSFLPAIKVRGQTTQVDFNQLNLLSPESVICDDIYLIPMTNQQVHVGATFDRDNTSPHLLAQSQSELYDKLTQLTSQQHITNQPLTGRVGFRYCSVDRLPMIGPLPQLESFLDRYQNLWTGKLTTSDASTDFWPNLYINIAHGARGITSSFLSARIVSKYITQSGFPVTRKIREQIHPARFLIRELKKPYGKRLPGVQQLLVQHGITS